MNEVEDESRLIKQLREGPKILINQDKTRVFGLTLKAAEQEVGVDTVAQQAVSTYNAECVPLDSNVTELTAEDVTDFLLLEDGEKPKRGGFGAVFKVECRSLRGGQIDRKLCMKMAVEGLRYNQNGDNDKIEKGNRNTFREAQILRKLSEHTHENIIEWRFTCTSTDGKDVFIVMEHFAADNLSHKLRELKDKGGTLPGNKLYSIMKQSAAAIQHLSGLEIVHCDIKPNNMLYDWERRLLKVIDFGSAVEFYEKTHSEQPAECCAAGTPEYMAYEILNKGFDGVGEKSDISSLGAVFFRLITMETPWHFNPEIALAQDKGDRIEVKRLIRAEHEKALKPGELTSLQCRIMDETQLFYKNYSRECDLIKRMLYVDPSKRPSCDALVGKLTEFSKFHRDSSRISMDKENTDSIVPTVVQALDTGRSDSTATHPVQTRAPAASSNIDATRAEGGSVRFTEPDEGDDEMD